MRSQDPIVAEMVTPTNASVVKPAATPPPRARMWTALTGVGILLMGAGCLLLLWDPVWGDKHECDTAASSGNMNGKYLVSTGAKGPGVPFNDDYASKGHSYFDVWAPEIATHYGEVFWTDQHDQPLPADIVEKFKGKVMAITGYEQDQVMVSPTGQSGVNPSEDVSVPINWAYNHHYMMWMTGSYSSMQKIAAAPDDYIAHGAATRWVTYDTADAVSRPDTSIPTSQMFSEGNGGESRKSFHGYPDGFAQLIDSPTTWHITPMQIDTRNRDCGATKDDVHRCPVFTPAPEPKQARYGLGTPKGTNYSGVLECPCNSRYGGDPSIYGPSFKTKLKINTYTTVAAPQCGGGVPISAPGKCYVAAAGARVNAIVANRSVSDASHPPGCSVSTHPSTGAATVTYNNNTASATKCAGPHVPHSGVGTTLGLGVTFKVEVKPVAGNVSMRRGPKGSYCMKNRIGVLKSFPPRSQSVANQAAALAACEGYCLNSSQCEACSVDCAAGGRPGASCVWSAIPDCGSTGSFDGRLVGDVSTKVAAGEVTLTLTGPADRWFGVGLDASNMADSPYTLVCNDTGAFEQKIGTCGSEAEHCAGTRLPRSITLVSNAVQGGKRTVVVTRSMVGQTHDHYTFDMSKASTIKYIAAIGTSQKFGYHQGHVTSSMSLTPADGAPACVCDGGEQDLLCETGGKKCKQFIKNCVPAPAGSLQQQHNPTCDSEHYAGGLQCCTHKRIMLDVDQEVRPELLRYHMKFRFWYQEYVPANQTKPLALTDSDSDSDSNSDSDSDSEEGAEAAVAVPRYHGPAKPSHYDLPRIYYQTEANAGEYDIPPAFAAPGKPIPGYPGWPANTPTPGTTCTGRCPDGPDCECVHTIHYKWKVSNMRLKYAGGHCHAPSCISIELWNNDTGQLLCRQLPVYGKGDVKHDKYDEANYVALPPCLWGKDDGLDDDFFLGPETTLLSIKRNRNTHMGHYGEMASWQMRGVFFPDNATAHHNNHNHNNNNNDDNNRRHYRVHNRRRRAQ